jgi:tripeptidyl-peptidase-1
MRFSVVALAGTLATVGNAASRPSHVLHEKRDAPPQAWKFESRANPSTTLSVRIGLVQSNLDQGHDHLMAVSDPTSPMFGQHWAAEKVAEFFRPADETVHAVRSWLVDAGIDLSRINLSKSKTWLNFNATVEELETLLETQYGVYRHSSRRVYIGTGSYRVPSSLKESIDFITPTIQFDTGMKMTTLPKRSPQTGSQPGPKVNGLKAPSPRDALNDCGSQITPASLRAM